MSKEETKEYWKDIFKESTKYSLRKIMTLCKKKLSFVEKEVAEARYLAAKELLKEKLLRK